MEYRGISGLLGSLERREPMALSLGGCFLRLLSVYESLLCSAGARELLASLKAQGAEPGEAESVSENACLAFYCLIDKRGRRLFADALEAVRRLTLDDLLLVSERYHALRTAALGNEPSGGTLLESLKRRADEPMERLRWRVLRAFHALPTSEEARRMGEADYLYCYAHLLLDEEEKDGARETNGCFLTFQEDEV